MEMFFPLCVDISSLTFIYCFLLESLWPSCIFLFCEGIVPSAAAYQQVNAVLFVESSGIMKDKRYLLERIYMY